MRQKNIISRNKSYFPSKRLRPKKGFAAGWSGRGSCRWPTKKDGENFFTTQVQHSVAPIARPSLLFDAGDPLSTKGREAQKAVEPQPPFVLP